MRDQEQSKSRLELPKEESCHRDCTLGRLLAGGQDPIFFASSVFGLFDPKKEENNLQIGAQGGATGRRHPMRPFLAPIQ